MSVHRTATDCSSSQRLMRRGTASDISDVYQVPPGHAAADTPFLRRYLQASSPGKPYLEAVVYEIVAVGADQATCWGGCAGTTTTASYWYFRALSQLSACSRMVLLIRSSIDMDISPCYQLIRLWHASRWVSCSHDQARVAPHLTTTCFAR